MIATQTFHLERYDITCSARACDDGTFQPELVVSRSAWPRRPRTIAVRQERLPTADVAIASAHTQALEWVRNFG